ncbi:MAG: helix-hairpin-helix domain-containing protein [Hydrogenophaga sp.]|nr:helix-hairpin-helix domain-containing protein [Hydrogenophaga sp.]
MIKKMLSVLLAVFTAGAFAAVDVNTASPADLDSVKGIGPGTSSKLLEVRKAGKFKDWPDLIERMPGIGEKRAAKLSSEGLTVNGEAFKPAVANKAAAPTEKVAKPAPAPTPKQ